jgi:acetyl esterase/lipase
MKTNLRTVYLFLSLLFFSINSFAQRYITEVFSSVDVQSNVVYASNYSYLLNPSAPTLMDLKMDVYTPAGDLETSRPLVIMIHTGSFGPVIFNKLPTGDMHDSAMVEMCNQFARRGYVVASIDYRTGWNPNVTGPSGLDIRRGTLLQAVYRAIQDVKASVRYFKKDVAVNSNSFGIDTTKIILGGMGSGGYVALAYSTLHDSTEFNIPKFICTVADTSYKLVSGQSYINTGIWGDINGYGGDPSKNNSNNSPGYSNNVAFAFNLGGAEADESWMKAGDPPLVCLHVVSDPLAPYAEGTVIVPTTGDQVVDVIGSYRVVKMADSLGNNNCFQFAGFSDSYTMTANASNDGYDGLFPLITPSAQAGPWEWWDSTTVVQYAIAVGLGQTQGQQIHAGGLFYNPDMSKSKALHYIDTIQNYVNPRIAFCLALLPGVNDFDYARNNIFVYPNPATDRFTVFINDESVNIHEIELQDVSGRTIYSQEHLYGNKITLDRKNFSAGIYVLQITSSKGIYQKQINLQ